MVVSQGVIACFLLKNILMKYWKSEKPQQGKSVPKHWRKMLNLNIECKVDVNIVYFPNNFDQIYFDDVSHLSAVYKNIFG